MLPIKVTPIFDQYFRFAYLRQKIFVRKLKDKFPLTTDPILNDYKFTNAYRASDRVSQYLIKNVIYKGPNDPLNIFFRIILFKLFNRIETWKKLEQEFGEISYQNYNFNEYNKFLNSLLTSGQRIYSAAYIMAPGKIEPHLKRKHSNHLKLIEMLVNDKVYKKISKVRKFSQIFDLLKTYPMIGNFLGYQLAIDINYSQLINFSENDFVIPGPGALSGISKCFIDTAGLSPVEIIKFMLDRQEYEFERLELNFRTLWGRPLKLIDCQNIFCEIDKYSRIAFPNIEGLNKRKRIKQNYRPHKDKIKSFWYPPKWGLNEKILAEKYEQGSLRN